MKRQNFSAAIFAIGLLFLLAACRRGGTQQADATQGDTLRLKYAQLLTIVEYDGYTEVSVADPWHQGRVLHTYKIEHNRPVRRALVTTSVHCSLLDELGCRTAVAGVCDRQYIHLDWVQQGCRDGSIADCGNSLEPTIERIAELQPDAIFLSPFQNSGGYGRVEQTGIEIVEMADYMEPSALGRAEWVRFYGRLLGQPRRADSLFTAVETAYRRLSDESATEGPRPTLLMDKTVGQVWYVPGGQSTTGRMLADAGARYPWADDTHSGSLALPPEQVLEMAADADVWLLRYSGTQRLTLKELLSENAAYGLLRAFRQGRVYGCNTDTSTFFEDTPFHPERLLRDIVCMIHPEKGEPRYYHRVE